MAKRSGDRARFDRRTKKFAKNREKTRALRLTLAAAKPAVAGDVKTPV